MKKLSEFEGQEHITSVLRAMVIKDQISKNIAIIGDDDLAQKIMLSYVKSAICENPQRGDFCDECPLCLGYLSFYSSYLAWNDGEPTHKEFCFSTEKRDGFLSFQVKTAAGTYVSPDVLVLVIHAFQGTKADVLSAAKKLSRELTRDQFIQQATDILVNIVYLKNNVAVVEVDKLEALRALAARMSTASLNAAIRVLWDAQGKTALSDQSGIEVASLLLSEAFQPTPIQSLYAEDGQTPIKVIEEDNLEQPLSITEMLRIAHE